MVASRSVSFRHFSVSTNLRLESQQEPIASSQDPGYTEELDRKRLTSAWRGRHQTCGRVGSATKRNCQTLIPDGRSQYVINMYTHQSQRVETLCETLGLEHHAQLVHLSNLARVQVAGVPILGLLGLVGEVVVVVFGVDIHGGG